MLPQSASALPASWIGRGKRLFCSFQSEREEEEKKTEGSWASPTIVLPETAAAVGLMDGPDLRLLAMI